MSNGGPILFVVDDDPSVPKGLESLIRSACHGVQSFDSARSFLAFDRPDVPNWCSTCACRSAAVSSYRIDSPKRGLNFRSYLSPGTATSRRPREQCLGFRSLVAAHAETVLEDWSSVNEWIEYEVRLNDVLPRYDDPVICTYDANLLNGSIAFDILRTHPVAIIGGVLHENPFFARSEQFFRELRGGGTALPRPYRGGGVG